MSTRKKIGKRIGKRRDNRKLLAGATGFLVMLAIFFAVGTQHPWTSAALAQQSADHGVHQLDQAPEPLLNGSRRPEEIPDSVAIRAFMQTLRVPPNADVAAHMEARVGSLNLSERDFAILVREVNDFDASAKTQEARIDAVRPSSVVPVSAISTRFLEDRYVEEQARFSALVDDRYERLLESVSPDGAAKLRDRLLHVKSRIKIYAVPDMSRQTL